MKPDADYAIIDAIKNTGRKMEDYVKNSTITLVTVDYYFFKKALETLEPSEALELYSATWDGNLKNKIDAYLGKMGIGAVDTVPNLGKITRAFFDERFRPLKPVEDTWDKFSGIVLICPFFEYTRSLYNEPVGCAYHNLLARHGEAFLNLLVDMSQLKGKVKAWQDKSMCKGDAFCRICIERK